MTAHLPLNPKPSNKAINLPAIIPNTLPATRSDQSLKDQLIRLLATSYVRREGRFFHVDRPHESMNHATPSFADVIRHRCHEKTCINPNHLDIGSRADNKQDDWDYMANGVDFDIL